MRDRKRLGGREVPCYVRGMTKPRTALWWLTWCLAAITFASGASAQDLIYSDDFEIGDTSRWSDVQGPSAEVFRFSSVAVRDPHFFVDVPFVGCIDITDDGVVGLVPSFNEWLQSSLDSDGNGDGLLDNSFLMVFKPFSPEVSDGVTRVVEADCTAPVVSTSCTPTPDSDSATAVYDGFPSGPCLEPVVGSTSGYWPSVVSPGPPCFVTAPSTFVVSLNGLLLPLDTLQIAATPDSDPETMFTDGLIMGFLTEEDADSVVLPEDLPLIGGDPISSILPGGAGCCASGDDRDTWDGESGWWIYLNFESDIVPFTE